MLTDRQKQVADRAFIKCDGEHDDCVYAAVEAVLADQDERIHNALNPQPAQQPRGVCKNRSTEEGRKFWDHVEAVTAQVVSIDDVEKAIIEQGDIKGGWLAFIQGVRARLAMPAEQTEHVACFPMHPTRTTWAVVVDKNLDHPNTAYNLPEKVAKCYAAALKAGKQ